MKRYDLHEQSLPTVDDIVDAATMLFDYRNRPTPDLLSSMSNVEFSELPVLLKQSLQQIPLRLIHAVLIAFARVIDRHDIEALPLSVLEFRKLSREKRSRRINLCPEPEREPKREPKPEPEFGEMPDVIESFKILSRLLLRQQFSIEESSALSLVSAWGWSIYLGCFDPVDPEDLDVTVQRSDGSRLSCLARDGGEPPTYRPRPELGPSSIVSTCSHAACNPRTVTYFYIRSGVPTRRGIRKTRIVDGGVRPNKRVEATSKSTICIDIDASSALEFLPGISSARFGRTLVGNYDMNTFSVIQFFEWQPRGYPQTLEYPLGFREMFDLRQQARLLSLCFCGLNRDIPREPALRNSLEEIQASFTKFVVERRAESPLVLSWPTDGLLPDQAERIYERARCFSNKICFANVWLFDLPNNPATRWLQLNELAMFKELRGIDLCTTYGLASGYCCIECASSYPSFGDHHIDLVLLRSGVAIEEA